jgi:hypothetical protein
MMKKKRKEKLTAVSWPGSIVHRLTVLLSIEVVPTSTEGGRPPTYPPSNWRDVPQIEFIPAMSWTLTFLNSFRFFLDPAQKGFGFTYEGIFAMSRDQWLYENHGGSRYTEHLLVGTT